jgi:hypothetical protein
VEKIFQCVTTVPVPPIVIQFPFGRTMMVWSTNHRDKWVKDNIVLFRLNGQIHRSAEIV